MGRKLAVGLVVVVLFAAAGIAFALLSGDADETDTAQGTTTTSATSATSTTTPSTTTPRTTAPTTTTTTVVVPSTCGTEDGPIAAAINAGVTDAADRAQVDQCRLAPVDRSWAGVHLVAKPGADFAPVTVVLHGGGGSWTVVGSGDDACSGAPQQVLVDLGVLCSGGGGL